MALIKKILVPIDFLDASRNVLKVAIGLAKKSDAKIYLLHAYRLIQPKILLLPFFQAPKYNGLELKREFENYSFALFKAIENDFFQNVKVEYEFITEIGFVAQAIKSIVSAQGIDLVVIGSNNTPRKSEFWGSNTLEVIKKIKVPILAIPSDASLFRIEKITLASDFKKITDPNIFNFIKNFATIFKANIQILNLDYSKNSLSQDKIKAKLEFDRIFDGVKHSFHFKSSPDFELGISEHMLSEDSDILIIIPRDHNFFASFFKRNLVTSLVLKTKIPLLTIHE